MSPFEVRALDRVTEYTQRLVGEASVKCFDTALPETGRMTTIRFSMRNS